LVFVIAHPCLLKRGAEPLNLRSPFRRGWRGFGILCQQDPRRWRPALVEHFLRRGKAPDREAGLTFADYVTHRAHPPAVDGRGATLPLSSPRPARRSRTR